MTPLYRLDGHQYSAFVFAPDHRLEPERTSIREGSGAIRDGSGAREVMLHYVIVRYA
jgi:hypothetical protein